MSHKENYTQEPHEGPHKNVPDSGPRLLNTDSFAPEDITVHLDQELPIGNLYTIYDALEQRAERKRKEEQITSAVVQAVAEALDNLDPTNPEEYKKPELIRSRRTTKNRGLRIVGGIKPDDSAA